ncbi:MAG: alpha/beta hydrolase [Moraxella sp.]|nr:alpha/beta hydrolase [Moraxella sp.]
MSFLIPPFAPPLWLKNPHLQTILPRYVVKHVPNYRRELIKDSLNESHVAYDFVPADDVRQDGKYQKPLVVLFHGMEGSSQSHYAKNLARLVAARGWHFVVVHFRSCGGVPVAGKVFYNAGDTAEIAHNLQTLAKDYATIYAMGVSLGGNALAKYMGEYGLDAIPSRAAIISAPVDLASASVAMERFLGRKIYTPYLLNPIVKKALANELTDSELAMLKAARVIGDFDNVFTAPRHGFRSKNDYYQKSSALPYLIDIAKPSLIITAKDDPFLGVVAEPADVSSDVLLNITTHGGHIGFVGFDYATRQFDMDYIPMQVLNFFAS